MAKDKTSFILYSDLIHTVDLMTNSKAGDLFKTILAYVNDQNPEPKDTMVKLAFEPIKRQLKRDLQKYERVKERSSKGGTKSAAIRLNKPQLYVLEFYNDTEHFIKIGVTNESIGRRYSSSGEGTSKLPYKFDVLYQFFGDFELNNELEKRIDLDFKDNRYTPTKQFGGHLECYQWKILPDLLKYIESFKTLKAPSTKSSDNVTVTVNANDTVPVNEKDLNKNNGEKKFYLNGEAITVPVSEYFKTNFSIFRNQWLMNMGRGAEEIEVKVMQKMDTDYLGYTFNDLNHIQNTYKSTWGKTLKNGKTDTTKGHNQDRTGNKTFGSL